MKVLLLCILHTGSSVTVLLLEQNIHIQVPKKELHTTKFSETCDDFKQQNSYLEWEEIHPSICTSKNPLYRKKEKLYHGSRRYRCKKLGLNYSWNNRLLSGVISKGSTAKPAPSTPSNTKPQTSNPSGSTTKITASESDYSIRIKKPDGLSSSSISSNDDYWNKQLQIIIDGDYRNFFNTASNRTIKDSLTYKVSYLNGKTYINLITSTTKGFSVTQTDSYIYVKYAAPKDMFYRIIVIDAGHGGKDSCATGTVILKRT